MSEWIIKQTGGGSPRNRRLGFALGLIVALYVAAVILFIVLY